MRFRLRVGALAGLAAVLATAPCWAAEIEDLGVAVRAVVYGNSQGCLAKSPGGRSGMFYIPYYSTTGGALVGIHPRSGEHVHVPLPSQGGYGTAVGRDGAVYVGGVHPGDLYRFDPSTGDIENLGGSQFGGTYIWACAASPDARKIYAACYPTAGVLEYDVGARKLRDLGRMSPSEQYARSISVDARGKVWVGIGTHADLAVWDPGTEQPRSVLPDQYKHNSCCYDVRASGDHVFCKLLYDHKHLIYDTRTQEPVAVFGKPPDGLSYMAARGAKQGSFYLYATLSGSLYRYRMGDAEPTKLVEGLGQVAVIEEDRYACAIDDQDFVYYDLVQRKEFVRRKLAEAQDGMALFALTAGADGKIYGSTYINMHLFSVDPENGKITDLGKALRWGGQVDSMHGGRDGKIYLGSYVHAVVSVYDPGRPWKIGTGPDCNPREIGPVGSGQYRTRCITLGPDGKIYVGSIPSYNSAPTGAFSRVDPNTGEVRTWLDLVPGGAVHQVVAGQTHLYGAGGGKFFVFDPQKAEVVLKLDLAVSAMALAPGGDVVGTGGGRVFVFSPAQRKLIHTADNPLGDFTHVCAAPDGNLYGINAHRVGRITPGTWQVQQVAEEGGKFLAADQEGRLYFGRGSRVLRLSLGNLGQTLIQKPRPTAIVVKTVKPAALASPDASGQPIRYGLTRDDFQRIVSKIPNVESADPMRELFRRAAYGARQAEVRLLGCTPSYFSTSGIPRMARGRFLRDADLRNRKNVAVLSHHTAQKLFPDEDPIGKSIHLNDAFYSVIGVTEPADTSTPAGDLPEKGDHSYEIYVPLATMWARIGDLTMTRRSGAFVLELVELSQIAVTAGDASQIQATAAGIRTLLQKSHEVADYSVTIAPD